MPSWSKVSSIVICSLLLLLLAAPAFADEPSPDYKKEPGNEGGYVAPLSQTHQPSYVPQSVALSGPAELKDWNEDHAVPPGYTPVERTRKGLIIAGAVTFGSLYMLSALIASAGSESRGTNPVAALWVPGVGPFIQMFNTENATANVMLVIDGFAQLGGLTMLAVGAAVPKKVLVRNDLVGATIQVAPMVGTGATGATVIGTF